MTNERKETIVFMAENVEGVPQGRGPERKENEQNAGGGRDKSLVPRRGEKPERTPPAPPSKDHRTSSEGSGPGSRPPAERQADGDEVSDFPAFPDKEESPEDQEVRERQEKLIEHITDGRPDEAVRMMLEDTNLNPEEELQKPEVQQMLQDLKTFNEEMTKPEEERDAAKLEAASEVFRKAPKHMQDLLRPILGIHLSEDQVRRILPETPVAPTEEGEGGEGRGITAPTEDQRSEEEREVEAAVKPFVQKIEDKIRDEDWDGAKDEAGGLWDKLKKMPWGKVAGRTAQGILYTAVATYIAYVFLMAKTSALAKK